jgi:hypothetical protein
VLDDLSRKAEPRYGFNGRFMPATCHGLSNPAKLTTPLEILFGE